MNPNDLRPLCGHQCCAPRQCRFRDTAGGLFSMIALGQLLAVVRCERKWAERIYG